MDLNPYREQFNTAIRDQLHAIERAMTLVNDAFDRVDARLTDLQENDAELKRLILEQGAELRAQGAELQALRDRLNGGTP